MSIGRIPIHDVRPSVACGQWPAKAVVGETVQISATVFREGHDAVAANLVVKAPDGRKPPFLRLSPLAPGTDRWGASVVTDAVGSWTYQVEAWSDPWATWEHAVEVKMAAGQDVEVELEEGARILDRALRGVPRESRAAVKAAADRLRDTALDPAGRTGPALHPDLSVLLRDFPVRDLLTRGATYSLWVDRQRALFGSWYEMFPRSEGASLDPPRSGTLAQAMQRLPAIQAMGFDIVYLPPVHPIGRVNRKGPNNTLDPGPGDPGSPWAIGSEEGGHDAVHPDLGTIEDFDAFVARTEELGMEVALDLALQCAPDHPWAREHPEWFTERADGSIQYAENPPKKYQDIYPVNFDRDPQGIYAEVLRVVLHWVDHGVKVFRVDNPHTKPVAFWEWLIKEVKRQHPDVLFLAEAFTRPAMMHMLGRVGFTQSYTYFTWRTAKQELQDYALELAEAADYMRPNFFVNTPDILHASLQYGGPPMFKVRAVLAALLSPTWGVYSGYELFEHVAVRPGSEEYLNSEKYQYRPRDWVLAEAEGRTLTPYLTALNAVRRAHPALQWLRNLTIHGADQPEVMCFSKRTGDDVVIAVVNLDPHAVREATLSLDLPSLGLDWGDRFVVHDEFTGAEFAWGQYNYVRLDPFHEPAHILTLRRA